MKGCALLVVALLGACLGPLTYAQANNNVVTVLETNGFTTFARLLRTVGAYDVAKSPSFTGTLLAPTNEAIAAFLSSMGLTAEEAYKRPDMLDTLIAYHIVPYKKGLLNKEMRPGQEFTAGTSDPNKPVFFIKQADGVVVVQDMQGYNAKIVKKDLDAGKGVVQGIDRVLMNDKVFFTIAGAIDNQQELEWDTLAKAAKSLPADLQKALRTPTTEVTLFAPSDRAFDKVPGALSLPKDKLTNILRYHIVAGYREVPEGFKTGQKLETFLKGQSLGVKVDRVKGDPAASTVSVIPEKGSPVLVIYPNTWAGKSILQGIDTVLTPAAKGTTEERGRRHLQQSNNARRYRGDFGSWDRANGGRSYQSQRNSQAAIRNASSGRAPASYATRAANANARSVGGSSNRSCFNC